MTGTPTKTKLTVALPTVQNVATALGTGNYEGVCNVTVQNTNATTPYAVSFARTGAQPIGNDDDVLRRLFVQIVGMHN